MFVKIKKNSTNVIVRFDLSSKIDRTLYATRSIKNSNKLDKNYNSCLSRYL